MKDLFSTHSDQYAKYRPVYPPELYQFINSLVTEKKCAWDCATGNGQVAFELSKSFERVFATDISQPQMDHAARADNIEYSLQPAEKTVFDDDFFDLVTVGQAIHWFDFDAFYGEVNRVSKTGGTLALVGYGRMKLNPVIDAVIDHFYEEVIGKYWNDERRYIDERYLTLPFPYKELPSPEFSINLEWNKKQFFGYLGTWSAVKHFIKAEGFDPLEQLKEEIDKHWNDDEIRQLVFPLLTKFARL